MACGTGKTFNSLRIAENETNGKGLILVFSSIDSIVRANT
jgi:predicted helicase